MRIESAFRCETRNEEMDRDEGRDQPVNRLSPEVKGELNWQDIKVQSAAFAVAKA
jgi:hypothetical protein